MTGAKIAATTDFAAANETFARLVELGQSPEAMLDTMGLDLVASTQRRFVDGVDPSGIPWLPSERAIAKGGKTLIKSNALVGGISHQVGADSVEVGPDVEAYAAIHQFGGQAGRNLATTIVARPYLGFSVEDEQMIADVAGEFFDLAVGN